ncbi:MAG: thioesterase II family protein [Bacillota bacterium]
MLFCLPYAGGSKSMYYSWKGLIDPLITLESLELKGRGKRYGEGFYEDFDEAVDDMFLSVKEKIIHNEYAFFGHSMGALLAYELYYRICDESLRKPTHIFFSGQKAPSAGRKEKKMHSLPDDEFLKEVVALGGTPGELLENKELMQLVLPILRSDFEINENYIYKERKDKIECDITVFKGKEEDMALEEILVWKTRGGRGFKIFTLEGNHFFINSNAKNITSIINSLLLR